MGECDERSAEGIAERHSVTQVHLGNLFDSWIRVAADKDASRADLQYGTELALPQLLHTPLDPELEKLTMDARKFRPINRFVTSGRTWTCGS
jgi:hypothetical protein